MYPTPEAIEDYQQILLQWSNTNARDYPWRHNRTPYRTAVAELMLRRTKADQVVPVFEAFLIAWPTLKSAALANPEEVQRVLYPLGLAWRARNMLDFFRDANDRFGGELPLDVEVLRTLPGVGDYVGAAIVCFADRQSEPLIDTNVVRVLGRIFGLRTDGEARRRADMRLLAQRSVYKPEPAAYHYGLLDFAARVCVARTPHCEKCPFAQGFRCTYYQSLLADVALKETQNTSGG